MGSSNSQKRPINDDYKGGRIFIGGLCVSRMSLITTCIGVCSCRIILIIMISAMVFTRISAEEESVRKLRSFLSSFEGNSIRFSKSRNGKETDHHGKTHENWYMGPLMVKLDTVLNRYEFNWGEVKQFYAPVEPCMPDKCGKSQWREFTRKIPERFKCAKCAKCAKRKSRKILKKKIRRILSKFQLGIESFFWSFQDLISHSNGSRGRRIEILCEFKNDLKMLMLEVESLLTKKRLKAARNRVMGTHPSPPTHARLIYELMIIQDSKEFLIAWKKTLSNAFACWNKRRRH